MTARDEVLELLAARMRDLDLPIPTKRAQMLLAAYDAEQRAKVLIEAADELAVSRTHPGCVGCRGGLQFAEAKIRRMADATTPTSKEQQR